MVRKRFCILLSHFGPPKKVKGQVNFWNLWKSQIVDINKVNVGPYLSHHFPGSAAPHSLWSAFRPQYILITYFYMCSQFTIHTKRASKKIRTKDQKNESNNLFLAFYFSFSRQLIGRLVWRQKSIWNHSNEHKKELDNFVLVQSLLTFQPLNFTLNTFSTQMMHIWRLSRKYFYINCWVEILHNTRWLSNRLTDRIETGADCDAMFWYALREFEKIWMKHVIETTTSVKLVTGVNSIKQLFLPIMSITIEIMY